MLLFKYLVFILINVVPLLVAIAFFTLLERKVIASVQRRKGPNIVGIWGLLQPVADGLKLLTQEQFFPKNARKFLFLIAPILVFAFSLSYWAFIPTSLGVISDSSLSLLIVHTISSLSVFGVFLAGIAGTSKYSVLGSIRAVAQFISYELCAGTCIPFVVLLGGSLCLIDIVFTQNFCGFFFLLGWPFAIGYFVSILAETNRTPFDLSEAEAELVAGFHTEYSSTGFALFFLGEYCNLLVFSTIFVLIFFGGWSPDVIIGRGWIFRGAYYWEGYKVWVMWFFDLILFVKAVSVCFLIILIRAGEPRLRFDQIMELNWKILLPVLFGLFFFCCEGLFFIQNFGDFFLFFFLAFLFFGLSLFLFFFKEKNIKSLLLRVVNVS